MNVIKSTGKLSDREKSSLQDWFTSKMHSTVIPTVVGLSFILSSCGIDSPISQSLKELKKDRRNVNTEQSGVYDEKKDLIELAGDYNKSKNRFDYWEKVFESSGIKLQQTNEWEEIEVLVENIIKAVNNMEKEAKRMKRLSKKINKQGADMINAEEDLKTARKKLELAKNNREQTKANLKNLYK